MKVLITGGYGFIGSHVAERFFKEGHEVFIIDNLATGSKDNVGIQHKFYALNVTAKECEEVFRINNIDAVIHLAAQTDVGISESDPLADSEANILGLVNMLDLSRKYEVKKFIFASSAAVYGNAEVLPLPETMPVRPMSVYGANKAAGENYCRQWKEMYGLDTIIMRFANVYGPRQGLKGEAGVISTFMKLMHEGNELVVFGNGKQSRDYIYVSDVADALYKAAVQNVEQDTFNIATNTENTLLELIESLSSCGRVAGVRHTEPRQGDIYKSRLDNSRAVKVLGWIPMINLREGLSRTYKWYESERSRKTVADAVPVEKGPWAGRPYLENIGLFAIMVLLYQYNKYGGHVNLDIGLDYNFVYIAIMGFLYGKRQSLLATVLSAALLIYSFVSRGTDIVALFYQPQYLVHLASYVFFGVVTGYATDNRERSALDTKAELNSLNERYRYLDSIYKELCQVKDKLYNQIVNSDNSIGKTYHIFKELDSMEVEDNYTAANRIISQYMKTDQVAIYTVSKNSYYLRQKTRMGAKLKNLPKSIRIEDFDYLKNIIKTKKIFVNKNLQPDYPSMAAPILYEDKIIAIVFLYDLPFESQTYYNENLLKITVLLISNALTKAYFYEHGIHDKKYIESTRILVAEEFDKVQAEIARRIESCDTEIPMALLKVIEPFKDYKQIYRGLESVIRAEDYLGLKQDGNVYLMLLDISNEMIAEVQRRIKEAGIDTVDISGARYV